MEQDNNRLFFGYFLFVAILIAIGFCIATSLFSSIPIVDIPYQPAMILEPKLVSEETNASSSKETENFIPYYLEDFSKIKDDFLLTQTDFLEINLEQMEMRLYKKGSVEKEAKILLKGDPQDWGGTAAGLYEIEAGYTSSFSVVANVYLPYALKFYGKYYIHGEPYYPGGGKFVSGNSGGCLRIKDEDAKDIYEMTEIAMPVLVIDKLNDAYQYATSTPTPFPQLSATSCLVADLDSGFVLAEKEPKKQLQIASLTKLMTAVVVAENVDLRKSILITEKMLAAYGATKGLAKGKRFRVVELFYPLLIESSNDAAEALSYFLGRANTLKLMQEKAKAILMQNTLFADPSGYNPKNISTAQDLFYLARYILNNRPPLLEITKGNKVDSFGSIDFDLEELWNKNIFINDETFVGGKTGFIKTSRDTALFIFRLKDKDAKERNIAIILLGSQNSKLDTQRIYIWLQKNYFPQQQTAGSL